MDKLKSKFTNVKLSYIALLFAVLAFSAGCGMVNDVLDAVNGDNVSIFSNSAPPVVKSTGPSSGESNVPLNRSIEIYFSKSMDKNSVQGAFSIFPPVGGSFIWDSQARSVIFDPDTGFDPLKFYTVTISTGAKDTNGVPMTVKYDWSFLTGSGVDTTPPGVVSEYPADGSTDVGIGSVISITFDEPMDQTSINAGTFTVKDEFSNTVSGNITYAGTTATFTPGSSLAYGTSYTVTVTEGVKDRAGNVLPGGHIWVFTTSAVMDTTPPSINLVSPADGSLDVPIATGITVAFSEPMDKLSAEGAFMLLDAAMQPVNGTFSWTGDTMLFSPASDLLYLKGYTVEIGTGAKDAAGNPLAAAHSSLFTTGAFQLILVGETDDDMYGSWGDSDWRIKKLDSAKIEDTVNWDKTFGASHKDYPTSSTVDSNGDIYIAGIYDGLVGNGEEVSVKVTPDFAGSLNGRYFVLNFQRDQREPEQSYYVWYSVNGYPYADPAIPGMQGIEIYISVDAPMDEVASMTADQLNYYEGVSATWAADTVTIVMEAFVDVTDACDGAIPFDTGFQISTVTQGYGVYDYQWWIKKFDSNGAEDTSRWNKKITVGTEPDGVMEDFAPVTVVTDSKNNVYVSGWVWNGVGTFFDWMIKKYDSNGNEFTANWNKIFTGNGYWDFPTGMAVDSADNVYVIGSYHDDPLGTGKEDVDWWIKKFDTDGNEDMGWNMRIDGGFGGIDAPIAVTVDGSDNVYVAGVFVDAPPGTPEIAEIYCLGDMSGSLNGRYFTLDTPYDSVYVWYDVNDTYLDPYIAGRRGIRVPITMDEPADMVAMATEFALNNEFYDATITRDIDRVTVANERAGNVEDAGTSDTTLFTFIITQGVDSGNADWEIKKFAADGSESAHAVVDYTSGTEGLDNSPTDIAIDSLGNLYVVGYSRIDIDPYNRSQEWVIKKYGPSLKEDKTSWDKVITGLWGGSASSVAVDPEGNVFVSGYLMNDSWSYNGNADWVVKKFSSNGIEERSGMSGDEILDSWFFHVSGLHDLGVSLVLP